MMNVEKVVMYSLTIVYSLIALIKECIELVRIGSRCWDVKRRERRPSQLNDPVHGNHGKMNLPRQGVKLHYVSKGDPKGKILLFIHGFPECWFSWRYQLQYFGSKSGFLAIAPDMRGYGDSDKPNGVDKYDVDLIVSDLVELVQELWKGREGEAEVDCLIGHDWGGFVAWRMTADYPSLVKKLVILNAPHPRAFKKLIRSNLKQFLMSWYIFFFQCPFLPELSLINDDLKIFDTIFQTSQGKNPTQEEIECYKYYFSKPAAMTGPVNYYRANFSKPKHFPDKINTPTFVIWGKDDKYLNEQLARCENYVNDFRYKYIEHGSHFVQFSHPDEVNELINEFIN